VVATKIGAGIVALPGEYLVLDKRENVIIGQTLATAQVTQFNDQTNPGHHAPGQLHQPGGGF
jgi:hypothetical protein